MLYTSGSFILEPKRRRFWWVHRESYLMFTLSSDKEDIRFHFRSNINEPLAM